MNEQTEDEKTTMQREWLHLQVQRFELDAERDRVWFEHIARQTRAAELQVDALYRIAKALEALPAPSV